jgi:hypothetical protein
MLLRDPASNANSPWITTASVSQIPMRGRKLIGRVSGTSSPISPSALKQRFCLAKIWQLRAEPTSEKYRQLPLRHGLPVA